MPDRRRLGWREITGRLRVANSYAVDSAVAAAVAVPVSAQFQNAPPGGVTSLGALLNAGTVLPLIWRRRFPFTVAVTVAVFALLVSAYHRPGQDLQYGALVASYTVADLGGCWHRRGFLGGLFLILGPGALLAKRYDAADFLLTLLLPLSAYLLGALARASRERAQALQERADELIRERDANAARAAAEERGRIARDMHDVLAHAVSIMVVQAEAGPVVVRTPERAERAFDVIAEAGRDAMTQLGRMLDVLREGQNAELRAPPPTMAAVAALVAQVDCPSLAADLHTAGEPRPLPADADVAAYRIVQEALTNAVKHAGAGSVTVRLDWGDNGLVLTVTDDGRAPLSSAVVPGNGGHGLVGIRERAAACGGHAEAGPVAGGGFQVTAWLPYLTGGSRWPFRSQAGRLGGGSGPAGTPGTVTEPW